MEVYAQVHSEEKKQKDKHDGALGPEVSALKTIHDGAPPSLFKPAQRGSED